MIIAVMCSYKALPQARSHLLKGNWFVNESSLLKPYTFISPWHVNLKGGTAVA
jgi:hypothetical protein